MPSLFNVTEVTLTGENDVLARGLRAIYNIGRVLDSGM
jgi:hypothetical protein